MKTKTKTKIMTMNAWWTQKLKTATTDNWESLVAVDAMLADFGSGSLNALTRFLTSVGCVVTNTRHYAIPSLTECRRIWAVREEGEAQGVSAESDKRKALLSPEISWWYQILCGGCHESWFTGAWPIREDEILSDFEASFSGPEARDALHATMINVGCFHSGCMYVLPKLAEARAVFTEKYKVIV